MEKTALNAQLLTTGLTHVFFITSNLLTAKDQICGKVLFANEKNDDLDFAPC